MAYLKICFWGLVSKGGLHVSGNISEYFFCLSPTNDLPYTGDRQLGFIL